jgi:hypothetical protein
MAIGPASAQNAAIPALVSANWATSSAQPLNRNPPSSAAVAALVNYLNPDLGGGSSVCSFRFADLRHSGTLSLVTTVNKKDGNCDDIAIIDPAGSSFTINVVHGSRGCGEDLDKVVQDLDGNGTSELVVITDFTNYEGASHCVASWPIIYGWTGSTYADISSQFESFYQKQLQILQKQITTTSSEDNSGYTPCLSAEMTKIERFVRVDPIAGFDDAVKWAGSSNPSERAFALPILRDIGTPEALADIKTLRDDSDRAVAGVAALTPITKIAAPSANAVEYVPISISLTSSDATKKVVPSQNP